MKKSLFLTLTGLVCILLLVSGCTTSSGSNPAAATTPAAIVTTPSPATPSAATVTGPTWTGSWDTTFDGAGSHHVTVLVQTNETVVGTYAYHDGRISGTVKGNHLIGKWYEYDGKEADRNSGPIDWVLSSDAKSFEGTWAYGEEGPDAMTDTPGTWTGVRIS